MPYGDVVFLIAPDLWGNPNYFTENFRYSSLIFDALTQPGVSDLDKSHDKYEINFLWKWLCSVKKYF